MSRLLPDLLSLFAGTRLCLALSADGIAIVQQSSGLMSGLKTGFKKQLMNQQFIVNNQPLTGTNWQSLINQLDDSLSQLKPSKNSAVTVVLSSDFVRYLILPAQQVTMNVAEKTAYVQAAYRDIYGAVVDGWHIKCHDGPPQQNTLAVAIDSQLLAALGQLMDQHQIKLHSVQPYLMAAFNGLIPQTPHKNGYLAVLENSKLLLIQIQNGLCQQLRTIAFQQDWQLDLQHAIQREAALNEQTEKQLFVYAPAHKNSTLKQMQGYVVEKIGLKNRSKIVLSDPRFALLEAVL